MKMMRKIFRVYQTTNKHKLSITKNIKLMLFNDIIGVFSQLYCAS
jgi:hypothetical protein